MKHPPPFAKNRHLRSLLRTDHGVFVGNRKHSLLSYLGITRPRHLVCDQARHILLTAPTRAGKGTCILVQNALSFPGSMLILDPKGEFRRLTIAHRTKFQPAPEQSSNIVGVSNLAIAHTPDMSLHT